MTRAELIRAILEECRAPSRPRGAAVGGLGTRSPTAGGGLASGQAPLAPRSGRGTLTDPQTGDTQTLRRARARSGRRRRS